MGKRAGKLAAYFYTALLLLLIVLPFGFASSSVKRLFYSTAASGTLAGDDGICVLFWN